MEGAIASAIFSFLAPADTATPRPCAASPSTTSSATKMKKALAEGLSPTARGGRVCVCEWGGGGARVRQRKGASRWGEGGPPRPPTQTPERQALTDPVDDASKEQALPHAHGHLGDEASQVVGQHVVGL